jgi:hypothetical protein
VLEDMEIGFLNLRGGLKMSEEEAWFCCECGAKLWIEISKMEGSEVQFYLMRVGELEKDDCKTCTEGVERIS